METRDDRAARSSAVERTTRIVTGLILMSFACTHLLSHAMGLFLLEGAEKIGRDLLMAPWRTTIGRWTLLAAFFTHLSLGLWAVFRRRHLRMPPIQAVQLGLGLTIPLLLIPHYVDARLGNSLYGLDDSYYRVLYSFWITSPATDLTRQFLLLLVLWTHGCIGLHIWLRYRRWYADWNKLLLAVAIAVPALALIGIINAGWDTRLRAATDLGFAARYAAPSPGTAGAAHVTALGSLSDELRFAYLMLLAAVFAARALRHRVERRLGGVSLCYVGHATVVVPRGFSILEASLFRRIPHVSLCGGKARCSTCRVRILKGLESLPPPTLVERTTLARIDAPDCVRLACQTRPIADVALVPLVTDSTLREGLSIAFEHGDERIVTALAVDLRDSTRLAAGKLPFDTLFIMNRFVKIVSAVMEAHGGHVTSIAGDGIMCVFGFKGSTAEGALNALRSSVAIWAALDQLNRDLAEELRSPLRFGMGLHSGLAVVGAVASAGRSSLQFLGDTGNVASRLETASKDFDSTMVVSEAVFAEAALAPTPALQRAALAIRGRETADIKVILIRDRREIAAHLEVRGK